MIDITWRGLTAVILLIFFIWAWLYYELGKLE